MRRPRPLGFHHAPGRCMLSCFADRTQAQAAEHPSDMARYDFTTLSPPDFEVLTRDLLQEKLGIHIESFKDGRDQGIDLRYTTTDSPRSIIQCKHYVKSGLAKLLSDLKNKEKRKVDKLKPDRYILFTSVPLSPANKDVISATLSPHIKHTEDIYGQDDINNLIGMFDKVERQHFKLWMTSTAILSRVLHARVFNQTEIAVDGIRRKLSIFVETPSFFRAREKISEHGVCLLVGSPGAGKSTVAEMVAMHHIATDWTVIFVSDHISEAFEAFDPNEKQMFLYDDFLGQTAADKLGKNEDDQIVQLIEACGRHKGNKRIILVTRDYIFATAKRRYEKLETSELDPVTCAVKVADLSPSLKAAILVNHLYFHDVPQETVTQLIRTGAARQIVVHPNYIPRIVEAMCQSNFMKNLSADQFAEEFRKNLDNPTRIWKHAFENYLSGEAHSILLALLSMGPEVESSDLERASSALCEILYRRSLSWLDYKKELNTLDGSFVRIRIQILSVRQGRQRHTTDGVFIALQNPSIKDFLNNYAKEHRLETQIFKSANFWQQVMFAFAQADDDGASAFRTITDEEMASVLRRAFRSPSAQWTHRQGAASTRSNDSPVARAAMLAKVAISHDPRVREVALSLSAEALHSLLPEGYESILCVSELYSSGLQLSSASGRQFGPALPIANWISDRISSHEIIEPDDYRIALEFYEQHLDFKAAEPLIEYLRTDFESWVSSQEVIPHHTTATSLEYLISELSVTAEALDADIGDQLRNLSDTLGRLVLDEEQEARDLEMDEWKYSRPGERVDEDDIATILGSLKSD